MRVITRKDGSRRSGGGVASPRVHSRPAQFLVQRSLLGVCHLVGHALAYLFRNYVRPKCLTESAFVQLLEFEASLMSTPKKPPRSRSSTRSPYRDEAGNYTCPRCKTVFAKDKSFSNHQKNPACGAFIREDKERRAAEAKERRRVHAATVVVEKEKGDAMLVDEEEEEEKEKHPNDDNEEELEDEDEEKEEDDEEEDEEEEEEEEEGRRKRAPPKQKEIIIDMDEAPAAAKEEEEEGAGPPIFTYIHPVPDFGVSNVSLSLGGKRKHGSSFLPRAEDSGAHKRARLSPGVATGNPPQQQQQQQAPPPLPVLFKSPADTYLALVEILTDAEIRAVSAVNVLSGPRLDVHIYARQAEYTAEVESAAALLKYARTMPTYAALSFGDTESLRGWLIQHLKAFRQHASATAARPSAVGVIKLSVRRAHSMLVLRFFGLCREIADLRRFYRSALDDGGAKLEARLLACRQLFLNEHVAASSAQVRAVVEHMLTTCDAHLQGVDSANAAVRGADVAQLCAVAATKIAEWRDEHLRIIDARSKTPLAAGASSSSGVDATAQSSLALRAQLMPDVAAALKPLFATVPLICLASAEAVVCARDLLMQLSALAAEIEPFVYSAHLAEMTSLLNKTDVGEFDGLFDAGDFSRVIGKCDHCDCKHVLVAADAPTGTCLPCALAAALRTNTTTWADSAPRAAETCKEEIDNFLDPDRDVAADASAIIGQLLERTFTTFVSQSAPGVNEGEAAAHVYTRPDVFKLTAAAAANIPAATTPSGVGSFGLPLGTPEY